MSGASEEIVEASDFMHTCSKNSIEKMNKAHFTEEINKMAKKGLRTVGVAYKILNKVEESYHSTDQIGLVEPIEKSGFIFLGLFGIQDLPRP